MGGTFLTKTHVQHQPKEVRQNALAVNSTF